MASQSSSPNSWQSMVGNDLAEFIERHHLPNPSNFDIGIMQAIKTEQDTIVTNWTENSGYGVIFAVVLQKISVQKVNGLSVLVIVPDIHYVTEFCAMIERMARALCLQTLSVYDSVDSVNSKFFETSNPHILIGTAPILATLISRFPEILYNVKTLVVTNGDVISDKNHQKHILSVQQTASIDMQLILTTSIETTHLNSFLRELKLDFKVFNKQKTQQQFPSLHQEALLIEEYEKLLKLCCILDTKKPSNSVICSVESVKKADVICLLLLKLGYEHAEVFHQSREIFERTITINRWNERKTNPMITTTISCRSSGIQGDIILHYDAPYTSDEYVESCQYVQENGTIKSFVSKSERNQCQYLNRMLGRETPRDIRMVAEEYDEEIKDKKDCEVLRGQQLNNEKD